jgi:hypothetical protein
MRRLERGRAKHAISALKALVDGAGGLPEAVLAQMMWGNVLRRGAPGNDTPSSQVRTGMVVSSGVRRLKSHSQARELKCPGRGLERGPVVRALKEAL